MADDLNKPLARIRVDGGAAANDLLMQLQSDFSGLAVDRPEELESTARGAAMLAGIGAGLFPDIRSAAKLSAVERTFEPRLDAASRASRLAAWADAIRRARGAQA
jgi:glycerol kinase